nr:winged helix-turn-helix domain-containing protein [Agitococcus sp.]
SFWEFVIDPSLRTLKKSGQLIDLSGGEFDLLLVLVRHPNRVLSREKLLTLVHGDDAEPMERAIDVQIHRLRKLIEVDAVHPQIIKTVWGRGYVFSLVADGV